MRVRVATIEEFCGELSIDHEALLGKSVRVHVESVPEQEEAITNQVLFCATAVVCQTEGSWLLEYMDEAGIDTKSNQQGSQRASGWRKQIEGVANSVGLRMRPGRWEMA